jgi:two-component system, LytTR family, sensor kinase
LLRGHAVMDIAVFAGLGAIGVGLVATLRYWVRGRRDLGTSSQRATYDALHTANLAAPPLRDGLSPESAAKAIGYLRRLLGTRGVALADTEGVLASDGLPNGHDEAVAAAMATVLASGHPKVLHANDLVCEQGAACPLRAGVVVPLSVDGAVVGALAGMDSAAHAGLVRACTEVARFVSTQLELAELDWLRQRAVEAELRFLRAQISPHFIYNALTAIESYVRSDPDRARDLLLGFAEFIRYTFRSHGQFATLADELRLIDTYLDLERARFGDRVDVTLRVAPEVLSVTVPSLILQPLVENAVKHGLERKGAPGRVSILMEDADTEARIVIEDDGVGMDPRRLRRVLAGHSGEDGIGLRNVDERLRAFFGDDFGLVFETNPGAGTKVTVRVPKFKAGVRAAS